MSEAIEFDSMAHHKLRPKIADINKVLKLPLKPPFINWTRDMRRYINPIGKKKVPTANHTKSVGVYPAFENQSDLTGL
jgi:hypothetical protein